MWSCRVPWTTRYAVRSPTEKVAVFLHTSPCSTYDEYYVRAVRAFWARSTTVLAQPRNARCHRIYHVLGIYRGACIGALFKRRIGSTLWVYTYGEIGFLHPDCQGGRTEVSLTFGAAIIEWWIPDERCRTTYILYTKHAHTYLHGYDQAC